MNKVKDGSRRARPNVKNLAKAPVDWWNKLLAPVLLACRFVSRVDPAITGTNFPYEAGDLDEHELFEVPIDQVSSVVVQGCSGATMKEVLEKIADLGLRPARLMDTLRWWLANPARHADCCVVALGSRFGYCVPVLCGGDGSGIYLHNVKYPWGKRCIFLAVRKSCS